MCDYSLDAVTSRPAKVGDKLVTRRFTNSTTCGLAAVAEHQVAVCLLPGTEVAFDHEVNALGWFRNRRIGEKVARFRKINLGNPNRHHDAFEFSNGTTVLVTNLTGNQTLTVLQLPIISQLEEEGAMTRSRNAPITIGA